MKHFFRLSTSSVLGLVLIYLVISPSAIRAQTDADPVHTEWTIGDAPENGWTVGDRIPLRLDVTYPSGVTVTLPELPTQWGPFEVLEQTTLDPVENDDGTFTAVREATVTLWAPGDHQAPPLAVRYRDAGEQLYESPVSPLTLTVVSVLDAGEREKRDLKPQVSLPRPPLWPWILGGLLLAALAGSGGWLLLSRLRQRTMPASVPLDPLDARSPEEIAYSELNRIAALDLPVQGAFKRHYTLVADCMRTYVEGRYRIPALDRTTAELGVELRQARVDRDHVSLLRDLLSEADLVKFAKVHPQIKRARDAVAQARHIVDVTQTDSMANQQTESRITESRIT